MIARILGWVVAWFLMSAAAFAQDGRWVRAETSNFILYGDISEARMREAARNLEVFDHVLRVITNVDDAAPPSRLEVFLFRGVGTLEEVWPESGDTIAGFYMASPEGVTAYTHFRDRTGLDGQTILLHEYAHHFMLQHLPNAYPTWYVEGFAEYVSTAQISEDGVVLGNYAQARADWLVHGDWLSMEQMLTLRLSDMTNEQVAQYYAQSWLIAHYIFNSDADQSLLAYIRETRRGGDPVATFTRTFAMTPAQFDAEMRRYVRARLNFLAVGRGLRNEDIPVQISRMPPSADMLLPLRERLRNIDLGEDIPGPGLLTRIRGFAADFPNDPFAVRVLARAEILLGSTDVARRLLEPQTRGEDGDVEAYYLVGYSYFADAEHAPDAEKVALYGHARRALGRAYQRDPNDMPTLYRYAQASMHMGALNDNSLNVLLRAYDLAPQVQEIGLNAAAQLIGRGRYEEAAVMLRRIAYSPHAGDMGPAARQLLEAAERGAAAAAR